MPNRDQLAAAVSRELRAAVAAQRMRSDAGRSAPVWSAEPEKQRLRWLYPLGGRGDTERLIRPKRSQREPWWRLTANGQRVQTDDFVYFYTGDDDAGVVGFARVAATKRSAPGAVEVRLRIDVPLSTRLIAQRPVPAAVVRGWLRAPTRAVEDLTFYGRDLDRLLLPFPGYAKHLRQRSGR